MLEHFAQTHFAGARLGDARLTKRLIASADRIARRPGGSLPDKMQSPKDLKGLYRLMNNKKVTHRGVVQPHFERTRAAIAQHHGTVLIVHDTTERDFTSKRSLHHDLGQLADGKTRGLLCHNSIAVTAAGQPLGLANQIRHARPLRAKTDTRAQRRADPARQSRLWVKGRRCIGPFAQDKRVVDVCDRGGDAFEFLDYQHAQQQRYLVRASINRVCRVGHGAGGPMTKLCEHLRSLPPQGQRRLDVPAVPRSKRHPARPGRVSSVCVAWAELTLRPPPAGQARGEHRQEALPVWGIRVWEPDPPQGAEAVEWLLLSNEPVTTLSQAWEKVDWYELRWPTAEEYPKGQKTGCAIEGPQFTTAGALKPMIGLLSVVAWLLLRLRWEARQADAEQQPASAVVPLGWVEALSAWRHGKAQPPWSTREFLLALARLGGHQNRKGDGRPGWQTLWKGWMKLHTYLDFTARLRPPKCGQT
jgi:hypothetical protein